MLMNNFRDTCGCSFLLERCGNLRKPRSKEDDYKATRAITASSTLFGEEIAKYKEMAEKRRLARPYNQEFAYGLYCKLTDYIKSKRGDSLPLTISGMVLASGVPKSTFNVLREGQYDYALYMYCDYHNVDLDGGDFEEIDGMPLYVDEDGKKILLVPISEIIRRALLMQEEETETRLYEKGRVGDIFSLKAKHGWQEEQKVTNNNTLVIASETDARKALKLLSEE